MSEPARRMTDAGGGSRRPAVAVLEARMEGGRRSPSITLWTALLIVYVVWGSTYLAIKVAEETMPPLLMASVRFLIAGALLYGWAVLRRPRGERGPNAREWTAATIIGLALFVGGNGGVVLAERTISSGLAALVVATVPLWLVVLGVVVLRDRVSRQELFGLILGFGGMVYLVGFPSGGGSNLSGALLVVVGSLCWAGGSLYARSAPVAPGTSTAPAMQMLAGGVGLGVAALIRGEAGHVDVSAISVPSWLAFWYLIVFGSIVAFSAYAWLIRNTRTSLVGTYAYVNPVVAVFLGALILDEKLTLSTFIGGGIIVLAVALIVTARAARLEESH